MTGLGGFSTAGAIIDSDTLVMINSESSDLRLRCGAVLRPLSVAVRVLLGARASSLVQSVRTRDAITGSVELDAFRCSRNVAIASDRSTCACTACVPRCVLSCHA